MWFRAKKPLVDIESGAAPRELHSIPESEVTFAVPTLQVAKIKEE